MAIDYSIIADVVHGITYTNLQLQYLYHIWVTYVKM